MQRSVFSMKKIILIGPSGPPWGGMAIQTQSFLKQYEKHQQPYCYIPLVPPMAIHKRPMLGVLKCMLLMQFYARFFLALCLSPTGMVHLMINSGKTWLLHAPIVCMIAKIFRKQLLINYRGGDAAQFIQHRPRWILPFLRMADYLVVQSLYLKTVFSVYGLKSWVIPNPIDKRFFSMEKRFPIKKTYDLLMTRHLEPVYDVASAIHAMAILKNNSAVQYRLTILGEGTQKPYLQTLIVQLRLAESVKLVGEVRPEAMLAYYHQADLVINTSLKDNAPNALLEANASGVPVITTAVGGIEQLYTHQKTAWFIKTHAADQLADAIQQLIEQPALYEQLSKNAFDLVRDWTWDNIFPNWQMLYSRGCGEKACKF